MEPIMPQLIRFIGATILAVALAASPAFARGGGNGGGFHGGGFHHGFRGGVFLGGGFFDPYFYDPYVGAYPSSIPDAAPPPAVWYYCPPFNAYYPTVPSCPVPWQPVSPP
jgi:hypothetical protein